MSRYREQVADALGALEIRGPLQYAWHGRRSRPPPRARRDEMDARARREYLLACLREELYWSFYCRGAAVPARWGETAPVAVDAELARAVALANTGRGGWEAGWTVERVDGDAAVVTSARLRARVPAGACMAAAGAIEPGAAVSLPLPADLSSLSPGFLTVVGDAGDEAGGGVIRVYWHVTRPGAPALVGALTSMLNAGGVPFRLKVLDHSSRFDRCDATVLYVRDADFAALRPQLASLAAELAGWLRPGVPALTLPLAPGVGLAEDEGSGESFGVRRCTLLADAIMEAHERGAKGAGARLEAVAARFARAGVQLDAPYLEPSLAGRHVL